MTYNRKQEDRRRRRRGAPPEILRKGHSHKARNEVTEEEEIEQQLDDWVPGMYGVDQYGSLD